MIKGRVDSFLQARVPITLLDSNCRPSIIEGVIDTGFNGQLCLSINEVDNLDLVYVQSERFELGDGSIVEHDVFLGSIVFDDRKESVTILISKSRDTLIGAALLENKKLEIDYPKRLVTILGSRVETRISDR